jgi:hypothetical protein
MAQHLPAGPRKSQAELPAKAFSAARHQNPGRWVHALSCREGRLGSIISSWDGEM